MNTRKLIYPIVILGSVLLISCASTTKVAELSSEIYKLNAKIDQVENNVNILKPEIENIKNETIRANKRLDNQSAFYRK